MRIWRSCCARRAASDVVDRGSAFTATVCVEVRPSAVSFRVYVPGRTSGPSGDGGVSPGFALISNVCENASGELYRRSQFVRLLPTFLGSGCGTVTQKLGSGGRFASGMTG